MCILSRLFVGFIDKKRIVVVADMILSPLGFVLTFILRYTGACVILARTARLRLLCRIIMTGVGA